MGIHYVKGALIQAGTIDAARAEIGKHGFGSGVMPLTGAGERVSLAAVARVSKTVDPADPDGI
jgi:hypothetical protein